MGERKGLTAGLLGAAAWARRQVRKVGWLHAPIHAMAERLAATPAGARMIRAVLEPQYLSQADYGRWVKAHDTLSDDDRIAIGRHIARFERRPKISVVMPVYAADAVLLNQAIASVRRAVNASDRCWRGCG